MMCKIANATMLRHLRALNKLTTTSAYSRVLLLCLTCGFSEAHQKSNCPEDELRQALGEIPALATRVRSHIEPKPFGALKKVYLSFGKCHDSALGEAISDLVVGTVVTNWPDVTDLFKMMATDHGFGEFVMSHIDGTANSDELKELQVFATDKCPPKHRSRCSQLEAVTQKAIKEM